MLTPSELAKNIIEAERDGVLEIGMPDMPTADLVMMAASIQSIERVHKQTYMRPESLTRVKRLTIKVNDIGWAPVCRECLTGWPCKTILALDGRQPA